MHQSFEHYCSRNPLGKMGQNSVTKYSATTKDCFYKTSVFFENMAILMCYFVKKVLKTWNTSMWLNYSALALCPGNILGLSCAFSLRSNKIDTKITSRLLCPVNIYCCRLEIDRVITCELFLWESSCCTSYFICSAIYSLSEIALRDYSCPHLVSKQGGGDLPSLGTKDTT